MSEVIVTEIENVTIIETPGAQGPEGPPWSMWRGDWVAGSYQAYEAVVYNGSSWISNKITSEEPGHAAADWDLLALQGDMHPDIPGYVAAAAASEAAAATSEANATASENATAADATATAADRVQTGLDVIATAADRTQTGLDVISTAADAAATAVDLIATNNDRIATAGDAAATAADLVAVAAIFDAFDDTYLGAKASDPTLDNDGNPLVAGQVYWNTTESEVRFYNGTVWERPEAAASASAAAAAASEGNAAADAIATAADVVSTNADAAATAQDVIDTAASAAAALASEQAAAASYDSFDDRYLGAKASDPSLDNDGNSLLDGALYWNTAVPEMRVYDLTNTVWVGFGVYDPSSVGITGGIIDGTTIGGTTPAAVTATDTTLAAIDAVVASVNAVDVVLYDTRKDSDGGAWRKRCSHLSWYNETIYGTWLGERADETAARAVEGASTNDYYRNTTDGKFYALNDTSGQTEVFRGNSREFPEVALIIAEANKVTIYDATDSSVPMWRVTDRTGKTVKAIAARDGVVTAASASGLFVERFVADIVDGDEEYTTTTSPAIVNNVVNDVAITTLPNAPIDQATGLPVPTIYAATDGGLSQISHDGNVWDWVHGANPRVYTVFALPDGKVAYGVGAAVDDGRYFQVAPLMTANVSDGNYYQKGSTLEFYSGSNVWVGDLTYHNLVTAGTARIVGGNASELIISTKSGHVVIKRNQSTAEAGAAAFISNAYNTGYMVGDIRGAWLANSKTADRSVKANTLTENGTVTEAAVATGAELKAYSGFSTTNYLEQPYNADLDFGTGDFCVMGWFNIASANNDQIIKRIDPGNTGNGFMIVTDGGGEISFYQVVAGAASRLWEGSDVSGDGWLFVAVTRASGKAYFYEGGRQVATISNSVDFSNASANLYIGANQDQTLSCSGSLALWRISATAPSAEQIKYIYETERPLFEENAACTIDGTSDAILALGYDDTTEQLHAMTSYGRSTFQGLRRVSSEATAVGTPSSISASGGIIAQGGSTAVDIYIPAKTLREELSRNKEQAQAFGSALEAFWFVGDSVETDFVMPQGWKPKFIYDAGLLKKEGASDDYTVTFDGFIYTVVFAVAPTSGNDIAVMGGAA